MKEYQCQGVYLQRQDWVRDRRGGSKPARQGVMWMEGPSICRKEEAIELCTVEDAEDLKGGEAGR